MGRKGRELVAREYTWPRAAQEMLEEYARIVRRETINSPCVAA
jgi:hypothetical protein